MVIEVNNKQVTTHNAAIMVFASVIEDVYMNFNEYARMFIKNFSDLNEEEIRELFEKREKVYDSINKILNKEKM